MHTVITQQQAYRLFEGGQMELQERFKKVVGHGESAVSVISPEGAPPAMALLRHRTGGGFVLEGSGPFYDELCSRAGVELAQVTEDDGRLTGSFR